jgi:hypothetical protein
MQLETAGEGGGAELHAQTSTVMIVDTAGFFIDGSNE